MNSRWRWAGAAVVTPVLLWAATAATGGASSGGGRTSQGFTLAAFAADPLAVWTNRSPGERGPGALLSTKPDRKAPTGSYPPPTQRVLPTIRERPTPLPVIGEVPPADAGGPPAPEPPPIRLRPGLPLGPSPVDYAPGFPFYGPGPFFGGGGGGGGGVFPGVPPPPPEPPVTPVLPGAPDEPAVPVVTIPLGPPVIPLAPVEPTTPAPPTTPPVIPSPVPEPATWLMMLLGVFAVGGSIRRAHRHAQA